MGTLVIARSQACDRHQGRPVIARVTADECSVLTGFEDGSLRLEPLSEQAPAAGAFRLCLERGGAIEEELRRPLAALQCLAEGVLLSQRGSGKLLFCPQPASVDLSSPVFLFGSIPGCMTSLAASASGGLLAATNSAGELCVWGAAYGAMLARVAIPTGAETTAVSFVTDSQIAASSSDGNVFVWHLAGSNLHLEAQLFTSASPVCLTSCQSAAGALLVAGNSEGFVTIFGCQEGSWTQLSSAQGGGRAVSSMSCCPAGALLAVARGASLDVYQLPNLELVHQQQHPSSIILCSFLRSGQLLVCQEAGGRLVTVLPPFANPSSMPAAATAATAAADPLLGRKSVRFVGGPEPMLGDSMPTEPPAAPHGSRDALKPTVRLPPPPLPPHPLIHLRQQQRQQGKLCQQPSSLQLPSLASSCQSEGQQKEQQQSLPQPVRRDAGTSSVQQLEQKGSSSGFKNVCTNTDADVIASRTLGVGAAPSATGLSPESSHFGVEEVEQPRGLPPVVATQLQQGATGKAAVPAGLSRRCGACAAFSSTGVGSPSSIASGAMQMQHTAQSKSQHGQPPQLQQPGSPFAPTGIPQASIQRPASPVKEGVFCSMASQEAGQLMPREGVRAMVVEHETNLAHTEVQSERLVRISRRVLPCALAGQQAQPLPQSNQATLEQLQPQLQQEQASVKEVGEAQVPQGGEQHAETSDAAGGVQPPSQQETMERPVSPLGAAGAQTAKGGGEEAFESMCVVDNMHPAAQHHAVSSHGTDERPNSVVQATEISMRPAAMDPGPVPAHADGRRQNAADKLQCSQQASPSLPPGALKVVNQRLSQLDLRLPQLAQSAACRGEAALQSAASRLAAGAAASAPTVALGGSARSMSEAPMGAHDPAALKQLGDDSAHAAGALQDQHVGYTPPQASQVLQLPSPMQPQHNLWEQKGLAPHTGQRQAVLAGSHGSVTQPSCMGLSPGHAVQENQEAWSEGKPQSLLRLGGKEPLPRLAVPQLNSSLLVMAAQMAQPPPPVPEHVLREARIRAATAATTFPPNAVVIPKPHAKESPSAAPPSPSKQVAKQLDPRWVAERQLRPRLEDLWRPPAQYARISPVPFTIQLSAQQVAIEFLGLC